MANLKIVQ